MTYLELQQKVQAIFKQTKIKKFKAVFEKEDKGYNWVLSFHEITTQTSIILHTKFIFKLDDKKVNVRASEFLYLYDLNCKYKLIKFADGTEMVNKIQDIIKNDKFGSNLKSIGKFMTSPAMEINNYFFKNKIAGFSVYDFDYSPTADVVPCQKFSMDFKFNVNNTTDIQLSISKNGNSDYLFIFNYKGIAKKLQHKSLDEITNVVGDFIKKEI